MRTLLLAALACAIAAGCSKKGPTGGAGLDTVNESFNSAGLKLDPFVPTDAGRFSATRCMTGRIEGVDAVLCEYGSAEAAQLGRKAGEDWIAGAVTGTALQRDRTLLVLADRARADPNGKSIHKIALAFQGKK
jgi:hypothetical protein